MNNNLYSLKKYIQTIEDCQPCKYHTIKVQIYDCVTSSCEQKKKLKKTSQMKGSSKRSANLDQNVIVHY